MKRSFLILVTLLLLLLNTKITPCQTNRDIGTYIGNIAPNVTLSNPDGENISLADLKGNIVLVDFWASWCRPCRHENPSVVKAYNDYKDKNFKDAEGFRIFSISLDKNADDWKNAIKADELTWNEHVSDLLGWRSAIAKKYKVRSIPMNFLLDKDGIIIAKNLRGDMLEHTLNNLVDE
nr:TlpA family protein disulfide reductase [Bacteroidota bacterium]